MALQEPAKVSAMVAERDRLALQRIAELEQRSEAAVIRLAIARYVAEYFGAEPSPADLDSAGV